MTADRWTVRGISADLQRAVADAARQEGRSVGTWVSSALRTALGSQSADSRPADEADLRETVGDLAERLAALEIQLADMGRQTDGRQAADTAPEPTPSHGRTNDRQAAGISVATAGTNLAAAVKAAREARRWTQRDLARESGITQPTIANFERGKRIGPESLAKMAAALGLQVGADG